MPPYYSREISRYEPPNPIKQKEREDLLEKVRKMTSEGSKGSKGEKWVEGDTDLSWDHEGLGPLPKSHKDRLNRSPKLPRVPKGPKVKGKDEGTLKKDCLSFKEDYNEEICPEFFLKENEVGTVVPQNEKQAPKVNRKKNKNDERWDFESPKSLVDKKTARWIKEQNEFLGKQKEREFQENGKVRDSSVFEPSGPIKVLQKQRANLRTKYKQKPQYLIDAQKGPAPHPPLVMTNKGDVNWRGQGKRYPLKEKRRTQWGGYGKQYGTGGERKGNQTYRTDGTQSQGCNTAYESQRQGNYFPTKSIGNGQGGNGGDEDRNDKKKYRDTEVGFENDSHEESDTEDSYELEITPQQLSQVTPGGGALKIKLSKKKPIKITAGAPKRESGTVQTKPENIQNSRQSILSSHIGASSESTQTKRRVEAPLLITPIHLGNNEEQRNGIPIKRESNPKDSDNYNLARERVTQRQKSGSRGNQGPSGVNNSLGNGGGGDSSGGTSEDKGFPGKGEGPPRRNGNQRRGGGDDDPDPSDDGNEDDSSSSTNSSIPKRRKQKGPKYVYVLQGPPGPKGQEGQPGQAGRDGRDGQDLSLTKVLEETLKAQKPNLDTTGLENSFDQFGRNMFEVLCAQQRLNQNLEEQSHRANKTQEFQVEAMQDMAQANFQMKFDHRFAGVPMYDWTDPDSFDDWLYQIKSLCEVSHRDVRVEIMG